MTIKSLKQIRIDEQEFTDSYSVNIEFEQLQKMAKYHSPRKRSLWINEAIFDFLSQSSYVDAQWTEDDPETSTFLLTINLGRTKVLKNIMLQLTEPVSQLLDEAVINVSLVVPENKASVIKPALVRAAISRRLSLGGKRVNLELVEDE